MAPRPIFWSLGIAGVTGLLALNYAGDLARVTEDEPTLAVASPDRPAAGPGERRSLTINADYRGHYIVHPSIENYRIKMMVDTGASFIALTDADARALGVKPQRSAYTYGLSTANGVVRGARVQLREVRLGEILVRDVEAVVLPAGALGMSLLGTSFLRKLSGYEVQGGRMILRG
ncbi:retropepsin-like aspartic protease family protein [Bosea sp. (in: a-proteobacteria)]|jgi:aspartyl protease family protein|uniref:retropepsin-like aspartic protease family protein n=1 Tax=Bosea sp. (in: a-proteobacteria) TaxID=1871050 RepID=UPI002FC63FEA